MVGSERQVKGNTIIYLACDNIIICCRVDRRIARKSREDPNLTAPEIREDLNLKNITVRTVQNRLIEVGFLTFTLQTDVVQVGLFGRRRAEKPFISPKNVKERLKFAKGHQDWTVDQWKNVLWSDESKFNMVGSDGKGKIYVFYRRQQFFKVMLDVRSINGSIRSTPRVQ